MRRELNQIDNRLFGGVLMHIIVLLLLGLSVCNCGTPKPARPKCSHLLPGLNKLRRGVDITKLDMLPLSYNGDDGFKNSVIDFHCAENKNRYIGEDVYNVPDEVSSIMNTPGGFLNVQVDSLKTSSDVRMMLGAYLGMGINTQKLGSFSASASYRRLTATFLNESRYVEHILSHQATARADLIPKFSLKLGKYAQIFINRLPKEFKSDPEKYFEFIRIFGTHYFSNIKFGGSFQLYLETSKSYYHTNTENQVKAQASYRFFHIIKVSGGMSWDNKDEDSKFISSSNQLIRYYGGSANLMASGGIAKWQPSVARNPWVLGGNVVPISDLILDKSKRKSMEKAVQTYTDSAYLDFLEYLLDLSSGKYVPSREKIANYSKQLRALREMKSINESKMNDLGYSIEGELQVPLWFHRQVELCYKWRAEGTDDKQCGGGEGSFLCAKVGNMTQYYRDNTDGRNGGCRMQWGIMNSGLNAQSSLDKIELCYKWRPDGESDQCGGGVERRLCASINKYTPEYRDNTDRRSGGCLMQWALMVPNDAPMWLRNMKLCFEWYPDGDPEQCGGGVGRLICTTTNKWTKPYKDDTDRKEGGCRMRWGIIPS